MSVVCKDGQENLGWVMDTIYSYSENEWDMERTAAYILHLCGESADCSLSVSSAASGDKLTKPSPWLVTMCAASTSFLFHFSNFVCRAAAFSQRGKCPCCSACNTRELVSQAASVVLQSPFHFPRRFAIVYSRTAATKDRVHHTLLPRVITRLCMY